tara:strand:+ start:3225 stop:3668 length:444 start_codon:yes stop_codon:yes gene_type:complete
VKYISTTLIEVLLKSIDRVGIKKTIKVLEITQNSVNDIELIKGAIILNTCNAFAISEKTLINGRKNVANRTNAIGVCALLLVRMCKLTQREVAYILKKEPSNINKYLKKYDNLDKNFKNDLEILFKIQEIERETLEFYDKNKKINNG